MDHDNSVWLAISKVALVWTGYLGSISLVQVQAVVGIMGGLAVIGYTCMQAYVLWRDKIVKYRKPGSQTRSTDTSPTPL